MLSRIGGFPFRREEAPLIRYARRSNAGRRDSAPAGAETIPFPAYMMMPKG